MQSFAYVSVIFTSAISVRHPHLTYTNPQPAESHQQSRAVLGRKLREHAATHGDSFQAATPTDVYLLQAVKPLQAEGFQGAAAGYETAKCCCWLDQLLEGCTEISMFNMTQL